MYIFQASCSTLRIQARVVEANNSYVHELMLHPQSTQLVVMFHKLRGKHTRVFCNYNFNCFDALLKIKAPAQVIINFETLFNAR